VRGLPSPLLRSRTDAAQSSRACSRTALRSMGAPQARAARAWSVSTLPAIGQDVHGASTAG